jgi:hypothetical protein
VGLGLRGGRERVHSPAIAPSRKTSTRSPSSSASSRSEVETNTALPSAAMARMISLMAALAITSTPSVGSSSNMSFERRLAQREKISFCWLPPESVPAS